jgi:hypothetical protein
VEDGPVRWGQIHHSRGLESNSEAEISNRELSPAWEPCSTTSAADGWR